MFEYVLDIELATVTAAIAISCYKSRADIDDLYMKILDLNYDVRLIHKRAVSVEEKLEGATLRLHEIMRQDEFAQANPDFVTCGGCGKALPTYDSFNPMPHDCDGIDHQLIAK